MLYNFDTDGQTDSGTRVLVAVQSLENAKHQFLVLGCDADAVILNGKQPLTIFRTLCADVDARALVWLTVLNRISNQILENLDQRSLADKDLGHGAL